MKNKYEIQTDGSNKTDRFDTTLKDNRQSEYTQKVAYTLKVCF